MPRRVPIAIVAVMLASLFVGRVGPALAQDASPAAGSATFADTMGLPELQVTVTDTGFEGLPDEIEAGRYVITATSSGEQPGAVEFVQLPEGTTLEEFTSAFAAIAAGPPGADATPGPGMAEESPVAGTSEANPLDVFYETYIAGGVGAPPGGSSAQAIVDLKPGSYVVWASDPTAPQQPEELTVTGDMPTDLPEPSADVTVTTTGSSPEYHVEFSGEIAPGPQTLEFYNDSDQPHFLQFIKSPGPVTMDQLMQLLSLPEDATPPPGLPNPEEFMPVAFASTISQDATEWLALNLEPGTYIALCFIPDRENPQMPHAAEGLVSIFTVGEGTPTS